MQQVKKDLWECILSNMPRVITNFDREPLSKTRGSFDRNFWHYKIRDFSSIVLQQGMILFEYVKKFNDFENPYFENSKFELWVDYSLEFMQRSQNHNGSFNEYYPNEAGIPPTGFGLYSIGIILRERSYARVSNDLKSMIQKSINYLIDHDEEEALNQESAALAGIFLCSLVPGIVVDKVKLERKLTKFLKSQSSEGWFPEYNGPDMGYLSVTIDCMWDIYTIHKDSRVLDAIKLAAEFIDAVVSNEGHIPIMINSRNTEYILPYGLIASGHTELVHKIFSKVSSPVHFLKRIDDRYLLHYVFQSCMRSLFYFDKEVNLKNEKSEKFFNHAGIFIRKDDNTKKYTYFSMQKAGVFYHYRENEVYCDFGWRVMKKGKAYASHWQSKNKIGLQDNNEYRSISDFVPFSGHISTPLKHFILRISAFFLGAKIIPMLKSLLIFMESNQNLKLSRRILINKEEVKIIDLIQGLSSDDPVENAPIYSFRHVASAAGMSVEEMFHKPLSFKEKSSGEYEATLKL